MYFFNIKACQHILLHPIHKIMIFKIASCDPFKYNAILILPSSSTGNVVLSNPNAWRYSREPSIPRTFSFMSKTTKYEWICYFFSQSWQWKCSYLKHFVAKFNLPVLFLSGILTDVFDVPVSTHWVSVEHYTNTLRYCCAKFEWNSPHLLMMSMAAFTFSLSLLKVWIIIMEASMASSENLCEERRMFSNF